MRRCASNDDTSPKDGGWIRQGSPHRLEKGKSALSPKGVDCESPTLVGEENETPFIRVWKPPRRGRAPASPSPPQRRTPSRRRACDQGDNRLCAVPDVDEVQLQRVGFVDACQLASAMMWHAVKPTEGEVIEYREDWLVFAAILRAVLSEIWRLSPPSAPRASRDFNRDIA